MRRRVSTSLTTGFLTRSIYTLLSKVVFNFFNSVNLLEFPIFDLHDCIYWSFSRCFRTTWKLLLTPGGSNQIFLKPFWVRQWYMPCSQLWFSMQTVSKAAFNSVLDVLWTRRSQYLIAKAHTLFIIGNLPSLPSTATLLAYLLTFNDFLQYSDWNLSICTGVLPLKSYTLYELVLRRIISLSCIFVNLIIILLQWPWFLPTLLALEKRTSYPQIAFKTFLAAVLVFCDSGWSSKYIKLWVSGNPHTALPYNNIGVICLSNKLIDNLIDTLLDVRRALCTIFAIFMALASLSAMRILNFMLYDIWKLRYWKFFTHSMGVSPINIFVGVHLLLENTMDFVFFVFVVKPNCLQ